MASILPAKLVNLHSFRWGRVIRCGGKRAFMAIKCPWARHVARDNFVKASTHFTKEQGLHHGVSPQSPQHPFPKDNDSRVRFGGARSSAHRAAGARSAAKEAAADATLTETTFMTLASGRAAEMLKRPCANREAHRVRRKAILPVINNNKIIKANIPASVLNIFEFCQAMKNGVVGELWSSCVDGRRAKNVEGILSGKMAASSSRAWLSASSFLVNLSPRCWPPPLPCRWCLQSAKLRVGGDNEI